MINIKDNKNSKYKKLIIMTKIKHISNKTRARQLTKTIREMKDEGVGEWLLSQYETQLLVVNFDIRKEEQKQEIFF